ncbi:MAG: hypothetical protein K2J30_03140, partial [Clostridia bacterium]|nr:hypothetical protein [Clostridia bacterium]
VSPLELLLILYKTKHLKRVYPMTKPSSAIKGRLQSIYAIKYSLTVKFEGDSIIIDKRPLSYREKRNIATICLCSVLAVSVAVGASVTAIALAPAEGEVTKLSQINFNSTKQYTLKRDIVLPENYSVEKTNCNIVGEGHKLIFGKGATLGEFKGKISGLTIESVGDTIFTSVSQNAAIESITVNVSAAITVTEGTALVAATNYGMIDGVTVNVSGEINALAGENDGANEFTFGGIVQTNAYVSDTLYGTVQNCTVNYSQFKLVGEASANASFGGVVGVNNGQLKGCTVTGDIVADTFDLAGVCVNSDGLLAGNVNAASLSQTSADTGWNPIVCGIVVTNSYAVENCENRGRVSSASTCGEFETQEGYEHIASAAGIAYLNRSSETTPYILNCTNTGSVESSAKYRDAYAAGVCLSSSGEIESCKNSGAVSVNAENGCGEYVGGITALAYGDISKSVNEGAISATGNGAAYIGGISARSWARFSICVSSGNISVTAQSVYAGGILGSSDVISERTIYGAYIFFGIAEYCIGAGKIIASVIGDAPAYVGGIAGYVSEEEFSTAYFGGRIAGCYFTGECVSEVSCFGNIVGVCGANIYEKNTYVSGNTEVKNFEENYYLQNFATAFGAKVAGNGNFVSAEDKGASVATIEDMSSSDVYKAILNELGLN